MTLNHLLFLTQLLTLVYAAGYSRHLKRTKRERKLSLLEAFLYYSSLIIIPLSAFIFLYTNWNS
ncbi:hypothetical protein HMPREF3213_03160 [Heyndrickxia coagulans]|uniref:Uncharacterized protein n=1 Tax=Heyndrickxia coagulans TaxID=1398 RepID=A0A133KEK2_HEYCO|nr:hypothetical protein HMPREF3213_03160 [Heyndrickxia coagulans]